MYVNIMGKTPLFQKYVTKNYNIQVALLYLSIHVLHPGNQKEKRDKQTHAASALLDQALLFGLFRTLLHLDRELMNAALCVQAHTVCPEYHC